MLPLGVRARTRSFSLPSSWNHGRKKLGWNHKRNWLYMNGSWETVVKTIKIEWMPLEISSCQAWRSLLCTKSNRCGFDQFPILEFIIDSGFWVYGEFHHHTLPFSERCTEAALDEISDSDQGVKMCGWSMSICIQCGMWFKTCEGLFVCPAPFWLWRRGAICSHRRDTGLFICDISVFK